MTAHPIDLIAGIDDGIDLDKKDQVARHIAACDTCRTVARTMQRVDGLIALPEPVLPLPERATPQVRVRVAGWASVVAVVLTLAVATAALVGSFRQTQVTAAADVCGVLAAANRSAGVRAASAKATAIELPSPLSGSWTACGYGDNADRAGPWLLFRAEPTATWELPGLLVGLTSADPAKQLVFGKFTPFRALDGGEWWITQEGTRAAGTGQAAAVVAEPYFFVVTAPSRIETEWLANAIVAELRRRPWPPLSEASKIDACNVITRAAPSAGLPAPTSVGFPARRHWAMLPPTDTLRTDWIWNNVCQFFDESGHDQHLWIRDEPTTLQQATDLLPFVSGTLPSTVRVSDWVQIEAGMWLLQGRSPVSDCPACPLYAWDWSAVAVLDEQRFFVVHATDEATIRLARAVLAELRRP